MLGPVEMTGGVVAAGHMVAERCTQTAEDRCSPQERPHLWWLPVKDLLHEVVGDVPDSAGEGSDEAVEVGASPQGERGEVEPGRPALGPVIQQVDVGVGK